MATSKNKILSDIELRLTKGKPSDDMDIHRTQISYWVDNERDKLLKEVFLDSIKNNVPINKFYLVSDKCLSPVKEADDCVDCEEEKRRYYITLTRDVMELPNDAGIVRVIDTFGKTIAVTTQLSLEMFRDLKFSQPSRKNQMGYREARNIFIEKLSSKDLSYFEYDVFYIPLGEGATVTGDSDYPLEDDLVPELVDRVVRIGLSQMREGMSDLENDGTDPTQYVDKR